jgi:hypothetical protein
MLLAIEASDLADLVLDVPTGGWTGYDEAREYYQQEYTSSPEKMRQLLGTDTVVEWFLSMEASDMTPGQAMDQINGLTEFVNQQINTAVYTLAAEKPCKDANGRVIGGVCAAKKDACISYIDAANKLFGASGSAFIDARKFAWLQLSVFFGASARFAVDAQMQRTEEYGDALSDSVAKCIRSVRGRVATFSDAMAALRAVDGPAADVLADILEPSEWVVVHDSFAARAKWGHENPHVRRESFRWVPQNANGELVYVTPSEARDRAEIGLCLRDSTAAMDMHVCPFIVASSVKENELKYDAVLYGNEGPGHAVNWKTGACTRTFEYCNRYNFQEVAIRDDTLGDTLRATDPASACSASDDRRAACTCGHTKLQKFGGALLGDTLVGAVRSKIKGL